MQSTQNNPSPIEPMIGRRPPRWVIGVAVAWLAALVLTTVAISGYASLPGRSMRGPETWPTDSRLAFDRTRPLLLMFIHPQCPCTLASLEELKALRADERAPLAIQLVYVRPTGMPQELIYGRSWKQAATVPGVTIVIDDGGIEAARFGAATSGDVRLYDTGGMLRFAGGITLSRGHGGENPGRDAIEAILGHRKPGRTSTPVFGCSLTSGCNQGATTCPVR